MTTLWIVYSLFLKRQNIEALHDCVNIWWDTDTYAAIMGGMLGSYRWKFYEDTFIEWLDDRDNLVNLAEQFSQKVTTNF